VATNGMTINSDALPGIRLRVPNDPFPADIGEGPAYTVHLLPNEVACDKVVFAAEGAEMDHEGYWIHVSRLRDESDWVLHLSEKATRPGHRPAIEMLIEALGRKFMERGDPYRL
jgi:hypothetical protein